MAKSKDTKKGLQIFDITADGKGISKNGNEKPSGIKRFFRTLKDSFDKILYVNIFMVLGNFPLFFVIAALSGYSQANSSAPMFDIFQDISPIFVGASESGFSMVIYNLLGLQNQILVPTLTTYIFYGIGALTLLTFGLVNVGTAYILRNIAMGEPVFAWSDFWYAIKRNWKQALPFGAIDALIHAILVFNIYDFMMREQTLFVSIVLWMNIAIFIIYFFMRYYIYVQMVTFKLSVFKILKNSLIFTLLGIKRNVVALLGILLGILLEILFIFGVGGILLPLGVAAPLAIMFSVFAYMKVYAAYFKIKEVMIDPYNAEHPEEATDPSDDEVIMHDEVTERERIAEIRRRNGLPDENYDE